MILSTAMVAQPTDLVAEGETRALGLGLTVSCGVL